MDDLLKTDGIPASTRFDEVIAEEVILHMSNGSLLKEACAEVEGAPPPSVIRRWAVEEKGFGDKFMKSMEMQAHMFFEEAVYVAKHPTQYLAADKLKVDTYLKAAGKLLPKVYGDKADITAVIPLQVITNLGDGVAVEGVSQAGYKIEVKKDED